MTTTQDKMVIIDESSRIEKMISRVGDNGSYQIKLYISFFALWLITAITVCQTSFLFLEPQFTISAQQICRIPSQQRSQYYSSNVLRSINTDFGPFICEKQYINGVLKSMIYFGTFFGLLLFSFYMDNKGRRFALLLTWSTTVFGLILVSVGLNLQLICFGLFLTGAGNLSALRITISTITQMFCKSWRQKGCVGLELTYGIAGYIIAFTYNNIKNWRTISIWVTLIPSIILLAWFYANMEQSPAFLLLTNKKEALKSLNRIGKLNKNIENILKYQDLEQFKQNRNTQNLIRKITFKDAFLLPSLKNKTIFISLTYLGVSVLYYAPLFIINYLNINIYLCLTLLSTGQFITIPLMVFIVEKIPRKLFGKIMFSGSALLTGSMIFLTNSSTSEENPHQALIMLLMFGFRLVISFYYAIFFLYSNELLPIRARGVSIGVASTFGLFFVSIQNIVISFCVMHNYNFMIILTIIGLIALFGVYNLPQTLNVALLEQIQEHQLEEQLLQKKKMSQQL